MENDERVAGINRPVLSVEMLPVQYGDCIVLQYGTTHRMNSVLIDGGPLGSYEGIRERLLTLSAELELLVVTHLDADHIDGIVRLLSANGPEVKVGDVWFNGWPQLICEDDILSPLAAEYLGSLIQQFQLPWNRAFSGKAICCLETNCPSVCLPGGLVVTVLSPSTAGLRRLRRVWDKTVRDAGLIPGASDTSFDQIRAIRRFGAHARLAAFDLSELAREAEVSDHSIPNGSSIALLVEFRGCRLILAGDAHPTVLESSIRHLLNASGEQVLRVDAFKISHHGSRGSITNSLLRLIKCDKYLISTDGSRFGHPDDEAIARIIKNGGGDVNLYFNFRQQERFWDRTSLQQRESFRVNYPDSQGSAVLNLL